MIGRTVAQYRIEEKLGQGGMGVVYRAWDKRLQRGVALKFLPEQVAADRDALQRLRREARAASGLNHPNICTVYELAEDGDSWFIVLEKLEGSTLAEKIAGGALPLPDIIDWAIQITDALDVAHARGIVHRDLKPSNIFVTDRGLIKILDFGLAKQTFLSKSAGTAMTLSMDEPITSAGSAVGTIGYMSPEQALGMEVDRRTDLFSAGAVLYEMVTGHRAFTGDTAGVVLNAILHTSPIPLRRLNSKCPPALEQIVSKALEKDRDVRYQSAADLRADLKRLKRDSESSGHASTIVPPRNSRLPLLAVAGSVLVFSAVIAIIAFLWFPRSKGPVSPGEWAPLTRLGDSAVQPVISHDGRLLAFIRGEDTFMGKGEIYVKALPDGEPVALTNDGLAKLAPAFSPDSSLISYGTCCDWDTWVVPVFGGAGARRLFANATALSWIDPDHLMFSEIKRGVHLGLVTSTKDRTQTRDIYLPAHERAMVHFSALSPDKKWVLAVEMGGDGSWLPCRIVPFDGSSGPRKVGPDAPCTAIAWSPDGQWMYFTAETDERSHIWRQRFPNGKPEQVTSGPTEESGIAFMPDGKSFVTSVGTADSSVWFHDSSGDRQISSQAGSFSPRFSPDGSKLYYLVRSSDANGALRNELWMSDLQGHSQVALPGLTFDAESWFSADYSISPDGTRVVFVRSTQGANGQRRRRLWIARIDGRSSPQEIKSDVDESEPYFTTEGKIYFRAAGGRKNFLYRMNADGSGRERVLTDSIAELFNASRDGAWLTIGMPSKVDETSAMIALYSPATQKLVEVCSYCTIGFSWDGKLMYLSPPAGMSSRYLYVAKTDAVLEKASKSPNGVDPRQVGGEKTSINAGWDLAPGPQPSTYAWTQLNVRRNLYRIPVR